MKRLYLVRHAKSSWGNPGLTDFDRPLNKRGKRDAPQMGDYLRSFRQVHPDYVLCSTAKRVRSTAKRLLKALAYPKEQVVWDERIYSGHSDDVLAMIRRIDNQYKEVMVIGHNPDMTELANVLTGVHIANMPTCGVAGIDFDIDSWANIRLGNLVFFEVPKSI